MTKSHTTYDMIWFSIAGANPNQDKELAYNHTEFNNLKLQFNEHDKQIQKP